VKREFHNRLNRLFVHPSLGDALDSGEIDFMVMQILEELVRTSNGRLQATTSYARNELIVSPLFEALFDCNIIWKSKYYDTFHLEHALYADAAYEWLQERKAQMNSYERILYWLFKKSKGVKLGSRYSGVPRTKDRDLS
jgi:hypothetical protein